jgi:hypothetical protein
MGVYSVDKLMAETRRLAAEYRKMTGKALPLSAEIAVHDCIRLLGLEGVDSDLNPYDALDPITDPARRVIIKGRVIFDETKSGHRIGQLKTDKSWDDVIVALMDEDYEPFEIYRAEREVIEEALSETSDSNRNKRGAMSVARFKIIGRLVWTRENGLEDEGYWDNSASV